MPSVGIRDYRALYQIARAVSSLATEEVLQAIVKSVTESLGAKGCALLLRVAGDREFVHAADYGLSEGYLKKGRVTLSPIIDEVSRGNVVLILDAPHDRRAEYPEAAREEGIASILSVPLLYMGDIIGILRIYTAERRSFTQEELDFVKAAADLSAIALNRAKEHEDRVASLNEAVNACSIELKRLEEGRRYLLRFLAMVGHDLKAPIAAVESYLNVLLAGIAGLTTARQKNILQRSNVRLQELVALINDLVDISRLEAGQIPMETIKASPAKPIEAALEVAGLLAGDKKVELRTELPDALPEVMFDAKRLQQVLVNLIVNAVNYTPRGGTVTLRVKDQEGHILFEVLDTGVGIPPQDLPRVFEEFFRGSNVEQKGTGLGLSIARRIVEYMGGKIWVESPSPETGQGTKFSFTLPRERSLGTVSGIGELPLKESLV
ncbi:MAG: GAF domain-containing sensor histidine kinase [Chloroflexi bacterium]|nr:GAF domain-containing sensor histidine kinase [Chloroflexota bacterium]